jgi:hypothetical protein
MTDDRHRHGPMAVLDRAPYIAEYCAGHVFEQDRFLGRRWSITELMPWHGLLDLQLDHAPENTQQDDNLGCGQFSSSSICLQRLHAVGP